MKFKRFLQACKEAGYQTVLVGRPAKHEREKFGFKDFKALWVHPIIKDERKLPKFWDILESFDMKKGHGGANYYQIKPGIPEGVYNLEQHLQ